MRVAHAFGVSITVVILNILSIIEFAVLAWVILSWIVFFGQRSKIRWRYPKFFHALWVVNETLDRVLAPLLKPFRKLLPPWKTGGLDLSPILLWLVILGIRTFVVALTA